jgi:hypothetical protein
MFELIGIAVVVGLCVLGAITVIGLIAAGLDLDLD